MTTRSMRAFVLFAGSIMTAVRVSGAQQDTARARRDTARLSTIHVTVTRESARSPLDLPYAITVTRTDSTRPGERNLAVDEMLLGLPGITVANRYNPTQDPRIAMRGFGARSAFGVRGVKVLRDGIPLTLPDGQTPIDYLDLESVGSVEAIRGSASSLYGNASGGVIDLRTAPASDAPLVVQARGSSGSFDTRRLVGSFSGSSGAWRYQGDAARTTTDGSRAYSHQRVTNGFGRLSTTATGTGLTLEVMLFDEPLAQNPGAITAAQLAADPRQADALSVRKGASKTVRQGQLGLTATHSLGRDGDFSATVFGGSRTLANPLTFAIVDVDRTSGGTTVRGTLPFTLFGLPHRLTAGVDAQRQRDVRHEWESCIDVPPPTVSAKCPALGVERGAKRKDQIELVSSIGPFARLEAEVAEGVWLSAGARYDYVRFEVDDRLITTGNPDDSGVRPLRALSPMGGVSWRVAPLTSLYATVSTAFETPTATELGNKPDGTAGINPELKPQHATTYESGVKGVLFNALQYDVALFVTRVRDELVPYEVAGTAGRRYFRNAGRTERKGSELGLSADVATLAGGTLRLAGAASYSEFHFTEFTADTGGKHVVFTGNRIPGIPIQQAQASATWLRHDLYVTLEGITAGGMYVDDGNTARAAGYQIANMRLGSTGLFGNPWVAPVIGVQNLFDRRYVSSVSVNATGGKFYEPAPGRVVYIGLTLATGH
ncbi:MAG: TonB-dependent receptor [Gemmatimonadota bacterium]|nr:TonB-dependent receptor [Gemmatimonadota bacterium]